jgi:hypothetical protein
MHEAGTDGRQRAIARLKFAGVVIGLPAYDHGHTLLARDTARPESHEFEAV